MSARWLEIGAAVVLLVGAVAHFASRDPAPLARTEAHTTAARTPAPMSRFERDTVTTTVAVRSADSVALEEMQELVRQNRISAARARARSFFETYPDSPVAEDVERLTGVHPRPALPE